MHAPKRLKTVKIPLVVEICLRIRLTSPGPFIEFPCPLPVPQSVIAYAQLQKRNVTHTSHTKIRHTTRNYATLGIWKRFFQFSGSLLIKRDTSSVIWHSDAL